MSPPTCRVRQFGKPCETLSSQFSLSLGHVVMPNAVGNIASASGMQHAQILPMTPTAVTPSQTP
eukprot:6458489-Amphidinium_carterae.1